MSNPRFTLEIEGGVARLTLNYPQRANAIDSRAIAALGRALAGLSPEAGLRALVLTGAGERVFCGGADLTELAGHTATSADAFAYDEAWDVVTGLLARLPCLTVARINGACVGGGLSLALACDLRLAAESAFFQYPTLKNGVVPSPADTARMLRLVGPARAKYIWLAGGRVSSGQAREWGLVERVVPLEALDKAVAETLAGLAAADPAVLAASKRMLDGSYRDRAQVERLYHAVYDRAPAALEWLQDWQTEG
jgi:enoyl-CoA hydratase